MEIFSYLILDVVKLVKIENCIYRVLIGNGLCLIKCVVYMF